MEKTFMFLLTISLTAILLVSLASCDSSQERKDSTDTESKAISESCVSDSEQESPHPDISVPIAPDYLWDLTDNILTISGQGGMPDYSEYMNRPWHEKRISSIQIADGITSISECAFFDCFGIKSISIPDSVLIIGARAFWRCDGLKDVVLPESLIYIGESAFIWCNNLASVTIPSTVSYIEDSAFAYCKKLSDIYYNGTKAQWESIKKDSRWDSGTTRYTVHCTDGDIQA